MKYIVDLGVLRPGTRELIARWDPVEVEAKDKWFAMLVAVKGQGLDKLAFSMSDFWKGSHVKVKDRSRFKKVRFEEEVDCVAKITSVRSKSKKRLGETLVVEEIKVVRKAKEVN
jgi:hypothetical protein